MRAREFVLAGVGIALLISVLAPFLSSPNPDGLESAAEKLNSAEKGQQLFDSPFSDYKIPFVGENQFSSVIALVLGALLIFAITYSITKKTRA